MRSTRVLVLFVFAIVACGRKSGPPAPVTSALPAVVPLASAVPDAAGSAAAVHGSATAPLPNVPCWSAAGYRGEVVGQPVFVRLGLEGHKLRGRYFYERVGIDIALTGSLADGAMTLAEGPTEAPTGRFEGRCEEPNGILSGQWRKGAKGPPAGSFRLVPIAPGDTPIAATKRYKRFVHGSSAEGEDAGQWDCSYKEERIELFGLRDPKVERIMNGQGLEVLFGPLLTQKGEMEQVERCERGYESTMGRVLVHSFRDFATVQESGSFYEQETPHPQNAVGFQRETWDLRTGRPLGQKDVLAKDPTAMLVACAHKALAEDTIGPFNGWESLSENFDLTETGIHFFAVGFPHVNDMTGQGPTVSYGVLLRDGYLRKDSPAKRAWEDVRAAAKGVEACDAEWSGTWQN